MSEEIIGIDKPAGRQGPSWWEIAAAVVIGLALLLWFLDAVHKSEGERAAEVASDFFGTYASGNAERFCELLIPEGREDVIASSALVGGPGLSCEEAARLQLDQLEGTGLPLDDFDDIDEEDLEDALDIDGDHATLDAASSLTASSIELQRQEDGEWLVDISASGTSLGADPAADASDEEVLDAADSLCVAGFGRNELAIADVIEAARGGARTGEFTAALETWASTEQSLLGDLRKLASGRQIPELDSLIAAYSEEAQVVRRVADDPRRAGPAFRAYVSASREVISVAARGGFDEFGCAAPPAQP